jgi:hypothetical protein
MRRVEKTIDVDEPRAALSNDIPEAARTHRPLPRRDRRDACSILRKCKKHAKTQRARWFEEVATVSMLCDCYQDCKTDADRERIVALIRHYSAQFPFIHPLIAEAAIASPGQGCDDNEVPF